MKKEYEHGNILIEILISDLNKRLGKYDGEMRKAIKRIVLNINHEEIRELAKTIVEMASKCEAVLEAQKIIDEYEVEIEEV